MSKPVIFIITAAWDAEASVWAGHCDDIPAAADAPTLDELFDKISAMALDLLPDNHPDIDPPSLFCRSPLFAKPSRQPPDGATICRPLRDLLKMAGCTMVRQGKESHKLWHSPLTGPNFAVPMGIPSRHAANAILRQAGLPKGF